MTTILNSDHVPDQSDLTAVEKFAFLHDLRQLPQNESLYSDLIPKTTPGPGEQYAFAVDLDQCTGCKACVTACHNENGLDIDETWRSVGLIQGGDVENSRIQHVTTACHHCLDPACMNGCPTLAYTKDPDTGIVKHLDDQCFGCQYCILKCPYDVPKYNKKRGIVHKCDMCISRLDVGQAPACVRACPSGAIRITLVDKTKIKEDPQEYVNIPGAPASDYTFPTTRYTTKKVFPANMESVDDHALKAEHAHWPLVIMLILTQLSVGTFLVEFVLKYFVKSDSLQIFSSFHAPVAMGIGLIALGASVLHLGRPHLAFRAVLGFRTSWLSREIIFFGLFAFSAILYSVYRIAVLEQAVLISGIVGIICSVMVYRDTKRPFWDNHLTTAKFFLTAIILGCTTILLMSLAGQNYWPLIKKVSQVIVGVTAMKLFLEATIFYSLVQKDKSFLTKTALLMTGTLKQMTAWRFICGLSGISAALILTSGYESSWMGIVGVAVMFALLLTGEMFERYLFFRAVVPLKMPGAKS